MATTRRDPLDTSRPPMDFGPLRQRNIFGGDMYRTPPFVPEPMSTFPMEPLPVADEQMSVPYADEEIVVPHSGADEEMSVPFESAEDRFNQLLGQMPTRQRPGKLRKLGASLIAIKNPKLAEHFMYAPFEHEMEDWQEKLKPAYQAAQLERQTDVNEQRAFYQNELLRLRMEQQAAREVNDERRFNQAQQKIDKTLSDMERLGIEQTNAIKRIEATGGEARKTEEVRQGNRMELEAAKKQGQQNVQASAQKSIDALNELLDEKDTLKPEVTANIGSSRAVTNVASYIPGVTYGRAGEAKIKRLKDLLTLDLIAEMKAQSKTGATGFGQMNMKELGVLEGAASKLDPAMDEEEFRKELVRIKEKLKKVLQPADGFTESNTVTGSSLDMKAKEYLEQNGMPATPANIQHAIRTGRVK